MPTDASEAVAVRALIQRLESLRRAGLTHLPKRRAAASATVPPQATAGSTTLVDNPAQTSAAAARQAAAQDHSVSDPSGKQALNKSSSSASLADKPAALQVIAQDVVNCQRCSDLACTRTQTVFGVGNPHARLCFVGEAPGADEDEQGIPFVGRAGQLLTKIIEACTLSRDEVYILNVLKCRPPGNRTPEANEIANCREFLERQLEVIQPQFICCLGAVAAQTVLDSTLSIGKLRGRFHAYRGIPVLCTYHPSYLLRNPAAKRDVWEDMKLLMQRMEIDVERKPAS